MKQDILAKVRKKNEWLVSCKTSKALEILHTTGQFRISVDWSDRFWRLRFFAKINSKDLFVETEAEDYHYVQHLIGLYTERFEDWKSHKRDFIDDSSEEGIIYKTYKLTFEGNYLVYTSPTNKRVDLHAKIIKFRELPGKGILILLDDIKQKYFFNLYLLDYSGRKKWKAKWPTYEERSIINGKLVRERHPNKGFTTIIVKRKKGIFFSEYEVYANSVNFLCKINPRNGRIIRKEFVK